MTWHVVDDINVKRSGAVRSWVDLGASGGFNLAFNDFYLQSQHFVQIIEEFGYKVLHPFRAASDFPAAQPQHHIDTLCYEADDVQIFPWKNKTVSATHIIVRVIQRV